MLIYNVVLFLLITEVHNYPLVLSCMERNIDLQNCLSFLVFSQIQGNHIQLKSSLFCFWRFKGCLKFTWVFSNKGKKYYLKTIPYTWLEIYSNHMFCWLLSSGSLFSTRAKKKTYFIWNDFSMRSVNTNISAFPQSLCKAWKSPGGRTA